MLILIACSKASDVGVERQECERLRDHFVELRLRAASSESQIAVSRHRVALAQALGDGFVASCQQLDHNALACALRADDLAAATACTTHK